MDERAADVVIADERVLQLDPRLLGEPECHGVRGIRHREHTVRSGRWVLAGKLVPQRPTHPVHRAMEHRAVGTREVNQLEYAAAPRPRGQAGELIHLLTLDAHEVSGFELP